jgi:hypothetical protein
MQLDPKHLDSNMIYYKKIVSNPDEIINYFENIDQTVWDDWMSSNNTSVRHGFSKRVFYSDSDNGSEKLLSISNLIRSAITSATEYYISKIQTKDVAIPNFFDIKKHTDGANMGPHTDSEDESNTKNPVLSAVLYLNNNYSGGEIEFAKQGITISSEPGSLILFPSVPPYYHRPLPVTSGTKYMVPFFLYEKEIS